MVMSSSALVYKNTIYHCVKWRRAPVHYFLYTVNFPYHTPALWWKWCSQVIYWLMGHYHFMLNIILSVLSPSGEVTPILKTTGYLMTEAERRCSKTEDPENLNSWSESTLTAKCSRVLWRGEMFKSHHIVIGGSESNIVLVEPLTELESRHRRNNQHLCKSIQDIVEQQTM